MDAAERGEVHAAAPAGGDQHQRARQDEAGLRAAVLDRAGVGDNGQTGLSGDAVSVARSFAPLGRRIWLQPLKEDVLDENVRRAAQLPHSGEYVLCLRPPLYGALRQRHHPYAEAVCRRERALLLADRGGERPHVQGRDVGEAHAAGGPSPSGTTGRRYVTSPFWSSLTSRAVSMPATRITSESVRTSWSRRTLSHHCKNGMSPMATLNFEPPMVRITAKRLMVSPRAGGEGEGARP